MLRLRRERSGGTVPPLAPKRLPADTVGLAFSGGGIRSATFCLGVLQALAKQELLAKVDFLSTVSGGGYVGSFYGAWLNRGRPPKAKTGLVDRALDYARQMAAGMVRFFTKKSAEAPAPDPGAPAPASGHFKAVERKLNEPDTFEVQWLRRNGRYLMPNGSGDALLAAAGVIRNWLAIHFVLGVFLVLVLCTIVHLAAFLDSYLPTLPGGGSWSPQHACWSIRWSKLFWLALGPLGSAAIFLLGYWIPKLDMKQRNLATRYLAASLGLLAAVVVLALLDSAGMTLWKEREAIRDALDDWIMELGGAGAVAALGVRRLVGWLQRLAGEKQALKVPVNLLLSAGALVLGIAWLVSLDTAAYAAAEWKWWGYGGLLAVTLLGTWHFGFVNLSSQASFYSSRLTRAYLGASNPQRPANQRISEAIDDDNIPYPDYHPHEVGGPLHLINVTVNETVDGRSQVAQLDRKGFNLAVGPAGMSAGARHHALWTPRADNPRGALRPIGQIDDFHCFATKDGADHPVGQLELGQWVGVSGAAFTTGLGARTSPALSLLCGFFNIRLGWWWDSGVSPRARRQIWWSVLPSFVRSFLEQPFTVQTHLLQEYRARFYGAARQHWYLSDGGHFENTAAYELVRRRVPFIVICDDGCDPDRKMEDFANLVRKARLDFEAEIEVLQPLGLHPDSPTARYLGTFGELSELNLETRRSPKAALLARVRYQNPAAEGLILLLKPTINGTEPIDVQNYQAAHPVFPQETTLDQFFDEEQWESYRKLGEEIGTAVFAGTGPGTDLRQHFRAYVKPRPA